MMQDARRRFGPLVKGAWIFAIVLVGVSVGLGGFRLVPHWIFVVSLAFGIFLVSVAYAKRHDAVMAELGDVPPATDADGGSTTHDRRLDLVPSQLQVLETTPTQRRLPPMAALLDIARYLIPVVGLLAAFAAVMAVVFLAVPRAIERLGKKAVRPGSATSHE